MRGEKAAVPPCLILRSLDVCNADNTARPTIVQPAAQEGTSSGFINRLAATAGSLHEFARVLSSVITIVGY